MKDMLYCRFILCLGMDLKFEFKYLHVESSLLLPTLTVEQRDTRDWLFLFERWIKRSSNYAVTFSTQGMLIPWAL